MLARTTARALTSSSARNFSSSAARQTKVAVLGAGGGIGQPLSLLLKGDPLVSSLSLYDIRGAPGVAADVNHIDSASDVRSGSYFFFPVHSKFSGHRLCCRSAGPRPRRREGRRYSRWCPKEGSWHPFLRFPVQLSLCFFLSRVYVALFPHISSALTPYR